jgi:hypothetical protein
MSPINRGTDESFQLWLNSSRANALIIDRMPRPKPFLATRGALWAHLYRTPRIPGVGKSLMHLCGRLCRNANLQNREMSWMCVYLMSRFFLPSAIDSLQFGSFMVARSTIRSTDISLMPCAVIHKKSSTHKSP